MFTHPVPSASHRCQRLKNDDGAFVQVPLCAVRVFPCCCVPEIVGGAVLLGAAARAAAARRPAATRAIRVTMTFLNWSLIGGLLSVGLEGVPAKIQLNP